MATSVQLPPAFIVGVPRSGTTLLAAMMNAHTRVSCGNETHFFERINGAVAYHLTESHHWPRRAVNYMRGLHHMGISLFDLYGVEVQEYAARLETARPSVPAILDRFMKACLARTGKSRWVEKTPGHLRRFSLIRTYFPTSRVICIFRDPRDVALSLMAVEWGTSRFSDGLVLWRSFYNYYKRYIEGDKLTRIIKYEDLVRAPAETAGAVCAFLGEDFENAMLHTSNSARDAGSEIEPYKKKASEPVDCSRALAWTQTLGEAEVGLCDQLLRQALVDLCYPAPRVAVGSVVSPHLHERRSELPNVIGYSRCPTAED
jgi:hypothetical protein